MGAEYNGTPTRPGGVTGRGFLPGQSGNPGGRPRGLAAAARAVVGDDGRELVAFFAAILRGDGKALGVRQVALTARMDAARWLADRAFGRAPIVIEPPDEPAGAFTQEQTAALREMPPELRDGIRQWFRERREEYLAREREAAERRMLSFMPVGPDGNGNGRTTTTSASMGCYA